MADTDGDGAPDGVEVTAGTNPKQNSSLPKPVITLQPVSITNTVGGGVTFQVTATNPAGIPSPLTYQWYKNGTAIPAGTNPNLIILPLTIAEAGNYSVVVSNSYGVVTSSIASLTVNKATPIITVAPTATPIAYGQTLAFSTLSGGTADVPGSFAFSNTTSVPAAGTSGQNVIFTPSDTANYNTATTSLNVAVNKATPTITVIPTATSIGYGQTLAFSKLSGGSASVAGGFAWTSSSTLPNAGTATQSVTFTPSDTDNYNTATASVNVTVNAALISSGFSHTLYLGAGATTVTAWGLNTDGRLGVGNMDSPVNWAKAVTGIPENATVTGLAAGGTHSLILAGGEVYAAGSDRFGQLGQGTVNGANKTSFTPVSIPLSTPVAVAAGGNHSLIVTASGKVFACGDNTYGQLAQPATALSSGSLVEVVFPGLSTKIVSVVAGADHNLALDEGGGVWVWGRNDSWQLGKNTRTSAERIPARIISSGAKSVAAGFAHSLVLKQDGTVLGFGRNTVGQVGQSSGTSYAKLPTPISGLSDIRLISAGTDSSFAIDQAGQLRSWGYNAYGELLLGYASPSSSPAVYGPTPSPIATNVFNVAGGGYSSLAVGAQGVIFGGRNDVGQAGNGPDPDQVVGDYYYEAGDLTLTHLTMDLARTIEDPLYDQIFVGNGAVTLNGILNLMFVGSYTGPVYGTPQTFDLIWAKGGIVLGTGYQLAFNQAGYLVESAVADKIVEGVSGKVLQATVRAVVNAADLAKAVQTANPVLHQVQSVSYRSGAPSDNTPSYIVPSISSEVEMVYSYSRPTGGVTSGSEYFVGGTTYRVEYSPYLNSTWNSAQVTGTTVTPLGGGYERATLRISASGSTGFLRLQVENPQATGINAGVGSAVTY
ncbi:MAG: immunoglobulin domain-containing protein [Verrucomicrobia bacterium]|nr:immunoglobulin domain-containing protein [Verrucomicrobiota bacterium]